ncbi:hypothetical protein ILYODFUR_038781 [Ilyodon furcidens]|uniref:C2H2-type domain-containing protein n=1 Tax=Ilyodon furcidens TaxID=33524 RepID=A0ABV0VCI0_9TELE
MRSIMVKDLSPAEDGEVCTLRQCLRRFSDSSLLHSQRFEHDKYVFALLVFGILKIFDPLMQSYRLLLAKRRAKIRKMFHPSMVYDHFSITGHSSSGACLSIVVIG